MKFSFLQNLSLQRKFILFTSVSVIVLMVVIGFLVTRRESKIMYSDIENQGRLLSETLAIPVVNDLIYERLGLVEEGGLIDNYVTEIFKRKDIDLLYIMILNENGRVISHNDFKEYGKVYKDPLTVKALFSSSTVVQKFYDKETGHEALDFATPLSIGKKRWGTLKFAVSLKKVKKEIQTTIFRVVLLTFLVLSGMFGMIVILSRRFIGPITQLAKTMKQAGGDMQNVREVDVKGKDEIALLGRNFNKMIERIKEANIELKETHEKLLQSEKLASIGILASGVAHEINNPLGGLFNCVKMLEQTGDNKEFRKKYLELLQGGLNKIETTVGRLLWMARKKEREPEWVEIKKVFKDIYGFLEYKIKRNNISYSENFEENLSINVDPNDLQQIIINLMINAVQSMENGGSLRVSAYRENSQTVIEVSDTGIGIGEEDINRIFDPFFTTKKLDEGTGLGLWLAYEIVKNYNGEISVRSKKGKGSTFTVKFRGV